MNRLELLTPKEMAWVDQRAINSGLPGYNLMEAAGRHIAVEAFWMHRRNSQTKGHFLVCCGPGNNGGDGLVAARYLADWSQQVSVRLLGKAGSYKGDAVLALEDLSKTGTEPLIWQPDEELPADVIIDALFGAGLDRALEGRAADFVKAMNCSSALRLAVDLPSGVQGESGAVISPAVRAHTTVSFCCFKPGHWLYPGREYCGIRKRVSIGIADEHVEAVKAQTFQNAPALWLNALQKLPPDSYKYKRGFALIFSGPLASAGAARLAAESALRTGAGLVRLAGPREALAATAARNPGIMLAELESSDNCASLLSDSRYSALLLGPGLGLDGRARSLVLKALANPKENCAVVLDADALTLFQDDPRQLFQSLVAWRSRAVLTPHAGEFKRLFPDLGKSTAGRPSLARQAAKRTGAVIVYKGPDSLIAHPNGRLVINDNAPPYLATAGSGDVLAGMIVGLAAGGSPAFEAAAAAVWWHGEAGRYLGPGLVAEDLPGALSQTAIAFTTSAEFQDP